MYFTQQMVYIHVKNGTLKVIFQNLRPSSMFSKLTGMAIRFQFQFSNNPGIYSTWLGRRFMYQDQRFEHQTFFFNVLLSMEIICKILRFFFFFYVNRYLQITIDIKCLLFSKNRPSSNDVDQDQELTFQLFYFHIISESTVQAHSHICYQLSCKQRKGFIWGVQFS